MRTTLSLLLLIGAWHRSARAEGEEPPREQAALVDDGEVAPLLHGIYGGRGSLALGGGWNTASDQPIVDGALELRVWRRLYVLAGVQWSERDGGTLRPGVGVGYTLVRRDEIGVAASFRYKPEGFADPEGELELGVAVTRQFGRATAIANLAYGQDPEARERDAEEGAGVVVRVAGRLALGVTERARLTIGAPIAGEPLWDVSVGPHAVVDLDHVLVIGFTGLTARRLDEQPTDTGIAASVGVARTF